MRRALVAVLLGAALVAAGCASAHGRSSPKRSGLATAGRAVAEIAAARRTDAGLFAIFPRRPGVRSCRIPSGAGLVAARPSGTCTTRVRYPDTHGHGEARVEFRESWANGHHSSWTLWEELPTLKVLATKLHGEMSPQMRLRESD
jgi:hypothetical protein